jgi:hypothetical protein
MWFDCKDQCKQITFNRTGVKIMVNESEALRKLKAAEAEQDLNERPFGERTIVTPAKTRTLPDIDHSGYQDGSVKTGTKTIEIQKETVDIDHSGTHGEDPKTFTNK